MSPRIPNYELYCPLLPVKPAELTAQQARANFRYFLASIPERLEIPSGLLSESGISLDLADGPVSFEKVGRWFHGQVGKRSLDPDELAARRAEASAWIRPGVPDWDLDDTTLSLCFDIAMYFGESLIARNRQLRWELYKTGKTMSDYNWPIIRCLHHGHWLQPVRIVVVQAYSVVGPTNAGVNVVAAEFERIYGVWETQLTEQAQDQ